VARARVRRAPGPQPHPYQARPLRGPDWCPPGRASSALLEGTLRRPSCKNASQRLRRRERGCCGQIFSGQPLEVYGPSDVDGTKQQETPSNSLHDSRDSGKLCMLAERQTVSELELTAEPFGRFSRRFLLKISGACSQTGLIRNDANKKWPLSCLQTHSKRRQRLAGERIQG
jgi:hypothetical protein